MRIPRKSNAGKGAGGGGGGRGFVVYGVVLDGTIVNFESVKNVSLSMMTQFSLCHSFFDSYF